MTINEVGFPSNSGRFLSTWLSSSFVTFSSRKSALSACFLINDRPMTIGSAVVQWLSKVEKNWLCCWPLRSINSCYEQRKWFHFHRCFNFSIVYFFTGGRFHRFNPGNRWLGPIFDIVSFKSQGSCSFLMLKLTMLIQFFKNRTPTLKWTMMFHVNRNFYFRNREKMENLNKIEWIKQSFKIIQKILLFQIVFGTYWRLSM